MFLLFYLKKMSFRRIYLKLYMKEILYLHYTILSTIWTILSRKLHILRDTLVCINTKLGSVKRQIDKWIGSYYSHKPSEAYTRHFSAFKAIRCCNTTSTKCQLFVTDAIQNCIKYNTLALSCLFTFVQKMENMIYYKWIGISVY